MPFICQFQGYAKIVSFKDKKSSTLPVLSGIGQGTVF